MDINNKILVLGSFNAGALEHSFVKGFKNLGYSVITFDITQKFIKDFEKLKTKILYRIYPSVLFKQVNKEVIKFCKEHQPEIIFICKGTTLYSSTLHEIKKYTNVIANYNPDHPTKYFSAGSGNKLIKESLSAYDILFTYSKKISIDINKSNLVSSYWIPFGYDSLKVFNKEIESNNHFLFVGKCDKERIQFIEKLGSADLRVFGDSEWLTRSSSNSIIRSIYQKKALYDDELTMETAKAAGTLNFLRPQNIVEDSHNMRTFEIPAMGGLQITKFTSEQAEFFESDKEIIFYDSIEELKDKLQFLRAHPEYGLKIKEQGYVRCQKSNYSFTARCAEMDSIMKKHYQ